MKHKIGVVVVHGIGDPKPGNALQDLTDALTHFFPQDKKLFARQAVAMKQTRQQQGRESYKSELLKFFIMPLQERYSSQVEKQYIFTEVFWGNVSRISEGWFGIISGLGQLFTGMATFIDKSLQGEPYSLEWFFNRIAWIISRWMLSGIVFALNLLLAIGFLLYLFSLSLQNISGITSALPWITLIIISSGIIWAYFSFFKESQFYKSLGVSCLILSPLWSLVSFISYFQDRHDIQSVWSEIAMIPINSVKAIFLGILILQIILIFCCGILLLIRPKPTHPPFIATLLAVLIQYDLWVIVTPLFWRILLQLAPDNDTLAAELYQQAIITDGFQWLGVLIAVLAIGFVIVQRRSWVKKQDITIEEQEKVQIAPRLLINPLITITLIILNFLGAIFILLLYFSQENILPDYSWLVSLQSLIAILSHINTKFWPLLLFLLPFSLGIVRVILDLVNDVVIYLFQTSKTIQNQFLVVLNYLIKEEVNELIIISHSQGTVISVDTLNSSMEAVNSNFENNVCLEVQKIPITLITMGSPLNHLYQHYFPQFYPSWKDPHWNQLFERIDHWYNLYRIDDYVGTTVTTEENKHDKITEYHVGKGEHLGYWRDVNVLQRLRDKIF